MPVLTSPGTYSIPIYKLPDAGDEKGVDVANALLIADVDRLIVAAPDCGDDVDGVIIAAVVVGCC